MNTNKINFSLRNILAFVAYCTLLISLVYYTNNFSFNSSVNTFTLGLIVWSIVSLTGIVCFFTDGMANNKTFIFAFSYLIYNAVMTLSNYSSLRTLLSDLVYNFLWFSLMVLFYATSKKNGVNRWYRIILRIALPVTLFVFITLVNANQTIRTIKTLNPVFYLLYLVPFAFLEDGIFRYIDLLLIFIGILLSNKRTALLAYILIIVYYLIKKMREENNKRGKAFKNILLGAVLIIGMIFIFSFLMNRYHNIDWMARLQSIATDGGSGRTERWKSFFVDMESANIIQLIFGHGVQYPYYHNDFMQIMFNDGLVGLFLYVSFCFCLVRSWIQMSKRKYRYTFAFGASMIIFFIDSMLGQVVVVHTWILQLGVAWGILLGDFDKTILDGNNRCLK